MSETETNPDLEKPAKKGKAAADEAPDNLTHVVTFAPGHPTYAFGKIYAVPDDERDGLIAAGKARLATEAEIEAMEAAGTAG